MTEPYILGKSKSHNKHYKRFKRTKLVAKTLVLIMIISSGYITVDIWRDKKNVKTAVSKTQIIKKVASSQVFRTEYFEFSAEVDWVFDEKVSSKTKYVYRKYRGPLIEHEINVLVNDNQTKFESTRVLPVSIENGTTLVPGPVSEHCKVAFPKTGGNRNPASVVLADTSLYCNPDDVAFKLVVGQVNKGNELKLKRANGELATYVITYSDLTFSSNGIDLSKIINSFQAK